MPVVGKTMALQRCLHPNPQNLWLCFTLQRRIKVASANQLTLSTEVTWDYPDGPNASMRVFIRGRQEGHSQRIRDDRGRDQREERFKDATL